MTSDRDDIIQQVLGVMRNGSRTDRFLEMSGDGSLFLATKNESAHQVEVPWCDMSDDGDTETAQQLIEHAQRRLAEEGKLMT